MRLWPFLVAVLCLLWPLPAAAQYDRQQFCRDDADEVMVLIDITSGLDERARGLLSGGVQQIIQQLDPGEQLRIATITDQVTTSEVLVTACVPWCPSSLLDLFASSCTEGLLRIENRRLRAEVRDALRARLETTAELPYSDILRTINAKAGARHAGRHLELFIFSDLIENSEYLPGKEFWSTPTSKLLAKVEDSLLVPDLANTSVHAFRVGRGGSEPRKALPQPRMKSLTAFWTAYFAAAGTTDLALSEYLVTP